ncbi:MAG: Druantia anti-phage system protein DruA [Flavobacteriales bacterium]
MAYSFDPKDDVETQWKKWLDSGIEYQNIDSDELRERTIKDLTFVSQMDVKEYTLFQKWCEVQEKYPTILVNDLWEGPTLSLEDEGQRRAIKEVKSNFWVPKDADDYLNLQPELLYCNKADDLPELWNCIRTFSSTMKNNSNIGRNLNYVVRDKVTKKYLGVICISSDFLDLTPRDNFIGWDRTKKTQGGMINHTAIGSTIVPLQPLGFNYVGGKLLALLCLTTPIQEKWEELYGDKLVGITTTSLYGKTKAGGLSQYDNLDFWQSMGFTSGSVSFEPMNETRYMIREWLKTNHTRKYFEWYVAKKPSGQPHKRDHKNRSLSFTYSKMKIPKELIRSEHARGIYFCPLYDKTNEFLRGEETGTMTKLFDTSIENIVEVWKTKHAKPRIKQLVKKGRVSQDTLFYDDLCYLTWEQTKAKYLIQVGR